MSDVEIRPRFVHLATLAITLLATSVGLLASPQRDVTDTSGESQPGYRVLATSRTSTMERELNRVGGQGDRLQTVMGGDTAFGGQEVVAIVGRHRAAIALGRRAHLWSNQRPHPTGSRQREGVLRHASGRYGCRPVCNERGAVDNRRSFHGRSDSSRSAERRAACARVDGGLEAAD